MKPDMVYFLLERQSLLACKLDPYWLASHVQYLLTQELAFLLCTQVACGRQPCEKVL